MTGIELALWAIFWLMAGPFLLILAVALSIILAVTWWAIATMAVNITISYGQTHDGD